MTKGEPPIVGLGLDIVDLQHFATHYGDLDSDLLSRCFTAQELASAESGVDQLARLAGMFAAKEAVFKALGGGRSIAHTDIEIMRSSAGQPNVQLHGDARKLARARSTRSFFVSITHSPLAAAAVAIALSGGPK